MWTWIRRALARFGTLRWRLTLFYSGLLAALLLGLGLFVYSQLEIALIGPIRQQLHDRARLVPLTASEGAKLMAAMGDPQAPTEALVKKLLSGLVPDANSSSLYAALLDASGRLMVTNQPAAGSADLPVLRPALSGVPKLLLRSPAKLAEFETELDLVNGNKQQQERGLGLIAPLTADASPPSGYLVLVAPVGAADATLNLVRLFLVIGVLGEIAIAALVGLPLTRLGLRPLQRIAATARHIGQGDLNERVALPGGNSPFAAEDDEVRQLARAFNAMLDRIRAAFQAQQRSEARSKQFAADASHELRSPLTVLGGYLDVLLMGAKDDPAQAERILRAMKRESDRLSRLVVDLLLLTRIDANGSAVLRHEPVCLAALLRRVLDDMRLLAGKRELVLDLAPTLESAHIQGDADALVRVLVNLLDNAVRYTPPDGRIVARMRAEGDSVLLEVSDDGCGIPAEQLSHVFDRFYRADQSRARETGNAGLGLAIAKSIIEAHGGTIRVVSTLGQGTAFTVCLPATLPH